MSEKKLAPNPTSLHLETIELLLGKDEVLRRIEKTTGLSTIRSWKLKPYHPGGCSKVIFRLEVSDGQSTRSLIVKFHKRNLKKRFKREIAPRYLDEFNEFAPRFLGAYERICNTDLNTPFQRDDFRVIVEDFIDGYDLIDLYEAPLTDEVKRAAANTAESIYHAVGSISRKLGWQLSNVSPHNIRFRSTGSAVIVDWGGQRRSTDPEWYSHLIKSRVLNPFLKQNAT